MSIFDSSNVNEPFIDCDPNKFVIPEPSFKSFNKPVANFKEIPNQDLFAINDGLKLEDRYYFAHCISSDFGMGKGIVVQFNKLFNMKNRLIEKYQDNPDYIKWKKTYFKLIDKIVREGKSPDDVKINDYITYSCILEGNTFNLITKEKYYEKPSYVSLFVSLFRMSKIAKENNIKRIAMPTIGCGLDKLEWDEVRKILIAFAIANKNIEIAVCFKEDK